MSVYPGGEHIDMAINVVGAAKDDSLTDQLADFLIGETGDTIPKVSIILKGIFVHTNCT